MTLDFPNSTPNQDVNTDTIELLAFRIGEQEYCVDIMAVREIRGWTKATPLPHAPEYMKGVINLRGTVLPIVDLSVRLSLSQIETNARDVVIVVHIRDTTIGLLVSAVSDIVSLEKSSLQVPPNLSEEQAGFIGSIAVLEGRMIRILDLPTILPKQSEIAG